MVQIEARRILDATPGHPEASLLLGAALRRTGDSEGALAVLAPLAAAHPGAWGLHYEVGAALAALGRTSEAIAALSQAVALNPQSSLAWRALADQRAIAGDRIGAEDAYDRRTPGSLHDADWIDTAMAFLDGVAQAADRLRDRFNMHPADPIVVRMLADAGERMGRHARAEALLAALVEAEPLFMPARLGYAAVLLRQGKASQALAETGRLFQQAPAAPLFLSLRAAVLVQIGEYQRALDDYQAVLAADPNQPRLWMSLGHVLKTVGRQADCILAYRRALALTPTLGEAYWSLANLKVAPFDDADVQAMKGLLARADLPEDSRAHLHFALGKAMEDERRFEASFKHYSLGNALHREISPYDAAANRDYVGRVIETFTPAFFAARAGVGCPVADPVFVVGMPRSGSTLVEQILASHSAVEGVSELPDLIALASELQQAESRGDPSRYPALLSGLEPSIFATLGQAYLDRTRVQRKLDRAFFVDKFPNNFMQIGLIHLILPNARIIDVRRDAMDCCLSGFKQNFAAGQAYCYDLDDLGRYYADYITVMAHFDAVLPGRVHRLHYEALVQDSVGETRRLLDHCGLEFEARCLRFHQSNRPVRTASSEQVRRPLFTTGMGQWKNFEPWLEPLKAALGPALTEAGAKPIA